jgi:hypothetical protein
LGEQVNDILKEPSWGRAQSIIQERFNKNIEYRFMDILTTDSNSETSKAFIRNDDLVVNLAYQKVRLGHLIIQRGGFLNEIERADIIDLVDFMLTPVIYNLYLKNMEKSILIEKSELAQSEKSASNIIPLQKHHYNEYETRNSSVSLEKIISKFLHLKASNSLHRKKVALKLHEMLGHSFFLDYSQISKTIVDAEELKDLDKVTLYVDEVTQLEQRDLQFLNSFIEKQEQLSILLLVGSSMSDQKIHQLNTTDNLKNDLVGFSFEIDRVPIEMQTSEEILELMFFDHTGYTN